MNSFFSAFDPFINKLPLGLLIPLISLILIQINFWSHSSTPMKLQKLLKETLHKLLMPNINQSLPLSSIMLFRIFILIYILNTQSLFPHIFPLSSHMIFTLSIALPLWLSSTSHNLYHSTKTMLSHLTPSSTPFPLIPAMIIIEFLSLMIQPLTLSLRLMANLTAGHLILTLASSALSFSLLLLPILITTVILTSLELMISIIQAYIFTALLTLYTNN